MKWVECKTKQIKKINLRCGWSSTQGCLAPSSPQRRPGCHQGDEKNSEEAAKFLDLFWKWKWSLPDSTSPSCTQWGRTLTPKGLDAGCRLLFLVFHTSSSWLSPIMIVIWFLHSFYRARVRSLAMLVSNSLTHSVTFSKLDWCDPGVWRCLLKTCWGCYC